MCPDTTSEKILVEEKDDTLQSMIFKALGAASVCWDPMPAGTVFESNRAKQIGEELYEWIEHTTLPTVPGLGLATSQELLDELHARDEMLTFGQILLVRPDYRTVDHA